MLICYKIFAAVFHC